MTSFQFSMNRKAFVWTFQLKKTSFYSFDQFWPFWLSKTCFFRTVLTGGFNRFLPRPSKTSQPCSEFNSFSSLSVLNFNSSPIAHAMKNSFGLWDLKISHVAHMAIETSPFFSISLKYMASTKLNRAIDLQSQIARMAVAEDIWSYTGLCNIAARYHCN